MTIAEQVVYWKNLAASDLEVARGFLQRGRDLHYGLFFGHMSIEKLLKALLVAVKQETPPRIHDLIILAKRAGLPEDETLKEKWRTFNTFNLEARYPRL